MKLEHEAWIKANVRENPFGECRIAAQIMASAFPDLRVVRGHYHCMIWGERGHWWCEEKDGTVVDPTAAQFPTKGSGTYREFTGNDEDLPTGSCANCGEPAYHHATCCSGVCSKAYSLWIQSECRK